MSGIDTLAKAIILMGVALVVIGLLLLLAGRVPYLGRLPGDIIYRRDNVTIYIPLATMLLLSILLTIALNLFFRR
ncbi:DUF2905 domain-containing protein [Thermomicrobiaceae bacterium CFH 74404]|uniref:DUF2905 domain-containing protein n=1 Tax=Thermalbibacter longus TaxID=2951981 RepID=A0AA42BBS4_9BACT|nr:DUF2905 domain-containing protein [Thermalbibacter longus]MCM8750149.1 DUF2905 domain-containing protein [Thermalbibacter longus]